MNYNQHMEEHDKKTNFDPIFQADFENYIDKNIITANKKLIKSQQGLKEAVILANTFEYIEKRTTPEAWCAKGWMVDIHPEIENLFLIRNYNMPWYWGAYHYFDLSDWPKTSVFYEVDGIARWSFDKNGNEYESNIKIKTDNPIKLYSLCLPSGLPDYILAKMILEKFKFNRISLALSKEINDKDDEWEKEKNRIIENINLTNKQTYMWRLRPDLEFNKQTTEKEIDFNDVYKLQVDPVQFAILNNLINCDDEEYVDSLINEVLSKEQKMVELFKSGKVSVLGAIIGKIMKSSSKKINPSKVKNKLEIMLK